MPACMRLCISVIFLALVATLIFFADLFWMRFACVFVLICVALAAIGEYYHIVSLKGYHPAKFLGSLASTAFLVAAAIAVHFAWAQSLPVFVLFASWVSFFLVYLFSGHRPLGNLAVSAFPIVYVTLPLGFILPILYTWPDGKIWLYFLLAVTIGTDVGAYFVGSLIGRYRLAPYVSPHKTWEGAIGGTLVAVCLGFYAADFLHISVAWALFLAMSLSILGQFGDLSESLLKRDVGVKDSANIPGLGGVLDIIDSLLFATPFLYFFRG